jgi:hypothetical protein
MVALEFGKVGKEGLAMARNPDLRANEDLIAARRYQPRDWIASGRCLR